MNLYNITIKSQKSWNPIKNGKLSLTKIIFLTFTITLFVKFRWQLITKGNPKLQLNLAENNEKIFMFRKNHRICSFIAFQIKLKCHNVWETKNAFINILETTKQFYFEFQILFSEKCDMSKWDMPTCYLFSNISWFG